MTQPAGPPVAVERRTSMLRGELLIALLYAVALVWLNAYICRDLFRNPTADMNSMHGFWIALAKHAQNGWFHSTWWPYWDGGMPFEFTYAPLIPGLIAIIHAATGTAHIIAFQSITAVVYCLAPATLFLMTWRLTRAPGAAFLTGLVYSLTSPTQLFVPDAAFSWRGFWDARRLYLVSVWDDTPHMAALALLPLAVLFLAASIEKRRWRYYVCTILSIALMAAASEFGAVEIVLAGFCLLFVLQRRHWIRNAVLTIGLGAFAYILIAPFLSPSLLRAISTASRNTGEGFSPGSLTAIAIIALGWVILWQFLPRWTSDWRLQFFLLFAYLTSSIPMVAAYLHRQFLPQPGRYKMEMEMALAVAVVFSVRPWFARARRPVKVALMVLLLALAGEQISSHRVYARAIMQPRDATRTIEYRTAAWAAQNLPGTRVMLSGSIAQWANAFTDVIQLSGGSWSQAMNAAQQRGVAATRNGGSSAEEDARVSLAWLQAFGVAAVEVNGPQSQEYWKPYAHPAKFEGLLPALWREDDVTFYRIPQASASLAHVVPRSAIVTRSPSDGSDIADVQRYVNAVEDASLPPADLRWNGSNRIIVHATAVQGQAVSIQVSYHPGWHATVAGRGVPIHRDGLGLMWLDPACQGPCELQLDYDGGWELRLSRYLSFAAIIALVALPAVSALKSRPRAR